MNLRYDYNGNGNGNGNINDGDNNEYMYVSDATSSAIIMMMTAFHEFPFVIHDRILSAGNDSPATAVMVEPSDMIYDTTVPVTRTRTSNDITCAVFNGLFSGTAVNKAPYDYYYGDTTVLIASPSIAIDTESSIGIDTESSIIIDTESSTISVNNEFFSAVTDAVTRPITSYTSPSSYNNDKNNNDDTNNEYMVVFNATSSADNNSLTTVTKTTQVYSSPSSTIKSYNQSSYTRNSGHFTSAAMKLYSKMIKLNATITLNEDL